MKNVKTYVIIFKYSLLLIAAFIWGTAFSFQRNGMEYVGPFTFAALRSIVAVMALFPIAIVILRKNKKKAEINCNENVIPYKNFYMNTFAGGIICGGALFAASITQQCGLIYIPAGKSGFITALYVVIVPFASIFLKKKLNFSIWISAFLSCIGLYFLCVNTNDFSVGKGEILTLSCAFIYAAHILLVDHFSPKSEPIMLSLFQFAVTAILSSVCMLIFENPDLEYIRRAGFAILYTGLFSSGIAYTLQVIAQRGTNPAIASLLMSFESMFSVLGGWIILGEKLTIEHIIGCIFMFVAILIVQISGIIAFVRGKDK